MPPIAVSNRMRPEGLYVLQLQGHRSRIAAIRALSQHASPRLRLLWIAPIVKAGVTRRGSGFQQLLMFQRLAPNHNDVKDGNRDVMNIYTIRNPSGYAFAITSYRTKQAP